jgi:hypothetical protein
MFFTAYIKELDIQLARFQVIEKRIKKDLAHMPGESLELSKSLTANAITLCCSTYELAAYAMMEHYCTKNNYAISVSNYFGDVNNRLMPSANLSHLRDFLEKFSKSARKDFVKSLRDQERSSLESLYTNRNSLAHKGGYASLSATLADVIVWHKEAKCIYRKLETRLKKALYK